MDVFRRRAHVQLRGSAVDGALPARLAGHAVPRAHHTARLPQRQQVWYLFNILTPRIILYLFDFWHSLFNLLPKKLL